MRQLLLGGAAIAIAVAGSVSTPQAQDIKRTPLQKVDVPGGNYEAVFGMAEFAPNATIAKHTHPGPVLFYIAAGEFVLAVEGQPEKTIKAGESSQVPAGAAHIERAGVGGAKALAVYLIPKGQPVATPTQ